jgi:hypothetical protein
MSRQRDKSAEKTARQERLSEALKANLHRRKAQARQRQDNRDRPDEAAGDVAADRDRPPSQGDSA